MGQAESRRYNRKLMVTSVVYTASIFVARSLIDGVVEPIHEALITAIPLVPAMFMIHFGTEAVRASDELQRRRHLESLATGFIGTAITVITFALLGGASILEWLGWIGVWMVMAIFWLIGQLAAYLRYR